MPSPTVTEVVSGASSTRKYGEIGTYEREFAVTYTTTTPSSLLAIEQAPGVDMLDPHPNELLSVALSFSVSPVDDSGLAWKVRIGYGPVPPESDPAGGGDSPGGGEGILKAPIWSASSSVSTAPCFTYYPNGGNNEGAETICNSAGDPLEGLEREDAEFRLTLTTYFPNHTEWLGTAAEYTNAVNSDTWHGKPPGSWKCQGASGQIQSASGVVYWEVTFEFAYRDTWNLLPWDIGFNERCNEDGTPSLAGTKRKAIVGQDKRPTKHPVALQDGMALPAGTKPLVINGGAGVRVYKALPFAGFGQIYTPFIPNT